MLILMQSLKPCTDVFRNPAKVYTLSAEPAAMAGEPMVYVNGLLMCNPDDYTLEGTVLTFTGQPTDQMDQIIVQVRYWTVG